MSLTTKYHERITRFEWQSTADIRAKQFALQSATNELQSAIESSAEAGEIDRLTSLKNDAQSALNQALEQSPPVKYTLSAFESEADYNSGKPALFSRELTGQVATEHAAIYANLATVLYQDASTKIENLDD